MRDSGDLRMVIDSVEDFAILITDRHGVIELWNRGAERAFGWLAVEAQGQHARLIFTPEDRQHGIPEAEMQAAEQHGRATDERWHLRKDGTRFFASGVLTVLRPAGRTVGFVKIARDLTERRALEEALTAQRDALEIQVRERTSELAQQNTSLAGEVHARRVAEAEIRNLYARLVAIQDLERRRIARDIHDGLGQGLTALKLNLELLRATAPSTGSFSSVLDRTERTRHELDRAVDYLTWGLSPAATVDASFPTLAAQLVEDWSERFSISAAFVGDGDYRLPSDAQEHLYRLIQEALHNVAKHAAAKHVSVAAERHGRQLTVTIRDDGRGFVPEANSGRSLTRGLGLTSMHERAALAGGTMELQSAPRSGTVISVRVPLSDDGTHDGE